MIDGRDLMKRRRVRRAFREMYQGNLPPKTIFLMMKQIMGPIVDAYREFYVAVEKCHAN